MKFGVSLNPGKSLIQEIESVSRWKLDFVEFYIEPPFNTPELLIKKAPLIKKTLQSNGLLAIGHPYWWCDLGSPDVTVRAGWLVEIKRAITAAAKFGIRRLDIHGHSAGMGFLTPALQALVMDNLVASLAFLVEAAKPHNIAIALENTWEGPEEFEYFLSKVKGLHATLDIGHAFRRDGMPAIQEILKLPAVDHIHMHDARGDIDHLPLGKGRIPLKQVAELLKKRKYTGTIAIEVIGTQAERKKSLDKFRELMSEK